MKKNGQVKKRRLKLKIKPFICLLLIIVTVFIIIFEKNNIKIKNIYITGNTITKDVEIIEVAQLKDYPAIYKINKKDLSNKIKTLPLIEDVEIKRNVLGKLTIKVTEAKILFYYKYNNKYITSTNNSIENLKKYYGYPTLINFTPDTIFENLVAGLIKIDPNIINMINEIEYTPYKGADNTIIDDSRFTLKMNDGNTVIIDTLNIKNLNEYTKIYASLNMDTTKGILYLDTITDDNIYFKSYESITENVTEEEKVE